MADLLHVFDNGVIVAIIAQTVIGLSLIWDKVLLERPDTRNVVNYIFWLGVMSILGLLLIPFGFRWPGATVFWIAFAAGAVQLAANYFYYDTLKLGEASQMLAIMGGFSPLFTYLIAIGLLREPLGRASIPGFALMVAGGFVMFFSERLDVKRILALTLMAAATFGLSSVLQKVAFEATNFVSGYVAFTFGTFAAAVFLLIRRTWRDQIFRTSEESSSRSRQMYFLNRFVNGVASFLIFVAISRASPAVVDAISGLRFVVIFAGVYFIGRYHPIWLKEQYGGWTLAGKLIGTALVVSGLVLVSLSGEGDSI